MKYPLLFVLFLFFILAIYAQSIKGTITNAAGEPLSQVTIKDAASNRGTLSDSAGNYAIVLNTGSSLLKFSAIGYAEKEVEIGHQQIMNVVLQEDYVDLNEVVVIGYGSMKKKDLTGAVSTLSGDKLEHINGTQLSQ